MKRTLFYNRLKELIHGSINPKELGASLLGVSVQKDKIVVQLTVKMLPQPFNEKIVLSIVSQLRAHIFRIKNIESEFLELGYSISEPNRLWVFISHDYYKGRVFIGDYSNGIVYISPYLTKS